MPNLDLLNEFWKRTEQERAFKGYSRAVRELRAFSLDVELADLIGEMAAAPSPKISHYLRSARLPFPSMWMECDYEVAFRHISGIEHQFGDKGPPARIGWMVVEAPPGAGMYGVTRVTFSRASEDTPYMASIHPVTHIFSPTLRMVQKTSFFQKLQDKVHPEVMRAMREVNDDPIISHSAWGIPGDSTAESLKPSPLLGSNVLVIEPSFLHAISNDPATLGTKDALYSRARAMLGLGTSDQYGELSFVVAALALINTVPVRYVPYRPSGHLRAGGRLRPFMSSSIISIEVPASRRRRRDVEKMMRGGGTGQKRPLHEVRGYYLHAKKLPRSEKHLERWEQDPDRPGGWRIWIPNHERGSGRVGFVQHTYEVVRGRGELPMSNRGETDVGATL